ncbi:hypothetical protein HPB48_007776 [Haemaphysalis longicornis]|uniref:Uncharacterized protein n=1 Tax=Haemaphysalis longicornis TaxID=44386 RepID=A0A9J6GD02_HAELO|nr:hypothetical protein HPB48_007776 [Haemaphysalis longicornis]
MAEIHRELSSVLRERSVFSNVLDKIEAKAKLKREWLGLRLRRRGRHPVHLEDCRAGNDSLHYNVLAHTRQGIPHKAAGARRVRRSTPLCPARLVYAKLLRHRVWLDGGGTAQGGHSLGASSAAHPPAASTFTADNTESTARAAPNRAAHKKASSAGKPQKG